MKDDFEVAHAPGAGAFGVGEEGEAVGFELGRGNSAALDVGEEGAKGKLELGFDLDALMLALELGGDVVGGVTLEDGDFSAGDSVGETKGDEGHDNAHESYYEVAGHCGTWREVEGRG